MYMINSRKIDTKILNILFVKITLLIGLRNLNTWGLLLLKWNLKLEQELLLETDGTMRCRSYVNIKLKIIIYKVIIIIIYKVIIRPIILYGSDSLREMHIYCGTFLMQYMKMTMEDL